MLKRLRRLDWENDRFFQLSLDMMCIANTQGFFVRVNPAFDGLGYGRDELTQKPFFDFVHPDDMEATRAELDRLTRGEPTIQFENRYRCKDGSYRWLAWKAMPDGDGTIFATARDITEQKRVAQLLNSYAEQMKALSLSDELTKLHNRRGFMAAAEQQLRAGARHHAKATVLFIDVDDLKIINDQLGHEVGDEALKAVADVMRSTFREEDVLARMGGDEFVALIADSGDGETPTQRLMSALAGYNARSNQKFRLEVSVGHALVETGDGRDLARLIQEADAAMYRHKQHRHAQRGLKVVRG